MPTLNLHNVTDIRLVDFKQLHLTSTFTRTVEITTSDSKRPFSIVLFSSSEFALKQISETDFGD